MANLDIQLSQLPSLVGLIGSDLIHIKRGVIDYKTNFTEILAPHANLTNNPHGVDKSQVGLANVLNATQLVASNNLSDLGNKGTSRTNLDVYSKTETQGQVNAHANLTNDPHNVTKAQVGLGSVNNGNWSNSYTSSSAATYATSKAVKDGVDNTKSVAANALLAHTGASNPHGITKNTIGLGAVPNFTASSTWNNNKTNVLATTSAVYSAYLNSTSYTNSQVNAHAILTNNPHNVTKAQVGLSNVSNLSYSDSYTTGTRYFATTVGLKNGLANVLSQANTYAKNYADNLHQDGWVRVLNVSSVDQNHTISATNMVGKEIYIVASDQTNTDEIGTHFGFVPKETGFNSDLNYYASIGANDFFWWNYTTGRCNLDGDLEVRQVWTRTRRFFPDIGTISP